MYQFVQSILSSKVKLTIRGMLFSLPVWFMMIAWPFSPAQAQQDCGHEPYWDYDDTFDVWGEAWVGFIVCTENGVIVYDSTYPIVTYGVLAASGWIEVGQGPIYEYADDNYLYVEWYFDVCDASLNCYRIVTLIDCWFHPDYTPIYSVSITVL